MLRVEVLPTTRSIYSVMVYYWALDVRFVCGELGRGVALPLAYLDWLLRSWSYDVNCFTICHFKIKF